MSRHVFWRSGFEKKIREQLDKEGIEYGYEIEKIEYKDKVSSGACDGCGSNQVFQHRKYTPDFTFKNGVRVEAKGRLDAADRKKLKLIKQQHPNLDLRIVFMRDNPIKTMKPQIRYSEWATKMGFKWAIKTIPKDWLI